ncbi:protein translocase subunit SecD [Dermacoccaceae bacterium W4C1]
MSAPILGQRRGRKKQSPRGPLALLTLILLLLVGGVGASTVWGNPAGEWTPKLGLDLEGGRQIILEPAVGEGQQISTGQVEEAVNIIRQRVDGSGVAEAEVSTLGARNIVVSIPGQPSEAMLNSLSRSSQLTFRAVIATAQNTPPTITLPQPPTISSTPTAAATSTATSGAAATSSSAAATASGAAATSSSAAASSGANGAYPQAFPGATPTPTPTPSSSAAATSSSAAATSSPAAATSSAATTDSAKPSNPSDTAWGSQPVASNWVKAGVVPAGSTYQDLLTAYNCTNTEQRELAIAASAKAPTVMCDQDDATKFLLGPVEVDGTMVSDASASPEVNSQGIQTGGTQVNLEFNNAGKAAFGTMTRRLLAFGQNSDQNRSAIIIDGQVISAPNTNGAITNGQAQISGGFTASSASELADQLKFGALPFSFKELTNDQISPQLGQEQLSKGILAGLIGFVLVVLYSLLQYRMLGLVTVASLVIASALTYLSIVLLGYTMNFRLSMAGVTGLIVAIGVTADSFIVYFERVRDEVRSGRPLRAAVETGWKRAKRTIIISDVVNFLAAAILYLLSESNVKAFAFTLGLTTIIDLIVVMLFTHPMLTILARTKFFGNGHRWSGLDPERLGAKTATYAGRGRVTIADRRAQEGSA